MREMNQGAGVGLERALVAAACGISAGVHAALVPEHLRETALLGWSFVLATVLLAACAVAIERRWESPWPARLAAVVLAGLIGGYWATRLSHVPGLDSTPEAVDVVGVATKVVEAAGLLLAVHLSFSRAPRGPLASMFREKGKS
jgi:hypothetical protein